MNLYRNWLKIILALVMVTMILVLLFTVGMVVWSVSLVRNISQVLLPDVGMVLVDAIQSLPICYTGAFYAYCTLKKPSRKQIEGHKGRKDAIVVSALFAGTVCWMLCIKPSSCSTWWDISPEKIRTTLAVFSAVVDVLFGIPVLFMLYTCYRRVRYRMRCIDLPSLKDDADGA